MNSDSSTQPEPDSEVTAQREASIQDVKRRVEDSKRLREIEEKERQVRNRRPFGVFSPDSSMGFMYEIFGGYLLLTLGLSLVTMVIGAIVTLPETLRWPMYYLVRSMDTFTGARALPGAPWVLWTIWGAIFGGCLGNWLLAPVYGNREDRSMLLFIPLLAMMLIAALLWAFVV